VQWARRPTTTELAAVVAAEEDRRATIAAATEQGTPPPNFGPLPTATDVAVAVYACVPHAISAEDAARVHQADCAGPASTTLPACGCTPEPLPEPEPAPAAPDLPPGW
jgi:hypothetical protein